MTLAQPATMLQDVLGRNVPPHEPHRPVSAPASYRTSDLARACGIHVNTVRFYERVGLIAAVPRDAGNRRRFSGRHLYQLRVIRHLYAGEWPGRAIRRAAAEIVAAMKRWELGAAEAALGHYRAVVLRELENARLAVQALRAWHGPADGDDEEYTVEQAAAALTVTRETIRNWERNGLLQIPRRGPNRQRYLTRRVFDRLRIIAVLRKSGHSVAVIHRALRRLREGGVEEAMRTFVEPGELEIFTAGDHYIEVLEAALLEAERLGAVLRGAGETA
jgi:DNA-binding transcriptional MerR regulator